MRVKKSIRKKQKRNYFYMSITLFSVIFLVLLNIDIYHLSLHPPVVEAAFFGIGDSIANVVTNILYALVEFLAVLIGMFVSLIELSVSEEFMKVLSNPAIYEGWKTVRDFLNIFFIFFLLFSAFSTIFQVSKYHIKSTWVMIVVMALLVNFSWPISRVIVDFSNVTMFYFLEGGASAGSNSATKTLTKEMGSESDFAIILVGQVGDEVNKDEITLTTVFMAIVAGFLFMVTMGAIALILIIRTIALAVLIVFASVGFVFAAFPSTRSYASQWWSAFMKYAFTGPVLIFMIILSVSMMKSMNGILGSTMKSIATDNNVPTTLMTYVVSLIVLWAGIIAAGKLGDGASSMVVGKAGALAKGGANKMKKGAWGGTKFVGRRADIGGGKLSKKIGGSGRAPSSYARNIGQRWNNMGEADKKKYDGYIEESKAHGMKKGGLGGDKNAIKAHQNKKVVEMKKKYKEDGTDAATLAGKLDKAGEIEARAISEALIDMKEGIDEGVIEKMIKNSGKIKNNDATVKSIGKKAAETGNAHLSAKALEKKLHDSGTMTNPQIEKEVYKQIYAKMDAKTMAANQNSLSIAETSPGSELHKGFSEKLGRTGFAREFQKHGNDPVAYRSATRINGTYL